jgi:hypothetical protein
LRGAKQRSNLNILSNKFPFYGFLVKIRQKKQVGMDLETEDELLDYVKQNYEVFDRFTFDYLFKRLLADGYDNEQAKDVILYNCALSLLVMQERLDNDYYLKMKADDVIAPDLLDLYCEVFIKILANRN